MMPTYYQTTAKKEVLGMKRIPLEYVYQMFIVIYVIEVMWNKYRNKYVSCRKHTYRTTFGDTCSY